MAQTVIWLVLLPLGLCFLVNGLPFPTPCDCLLGLECLLSSAPQGSLLEEMFPLLEALLCPGAHGPPWALPQLWAIPYYSFLSLPHTDEPRGMMGR